MPIAVLGNQGILLPADTTANRPTSGNEFSNGVLRYNTTTNKVEGYVNSAWASILTENDVSFGIEVAYEDPANGDLVIDFHNSTVDLSANAEMQKVDTYVGFNNSATSYSITSGGKLRVSV